MSNSREGGNTGRTRAEPGTIVPFKFDVRALQSNIARIEVDSQALWQMLTDSGSEHLQKEVIKNIKEMLNDKETKNLSEATLQTAFEERMRKSLIEICTDSRYCTQSDRMARIIKGMSIHSTPFPVIPALGLNPLEIINPRLQGGCEAGGVCIRARLTSEGHKTLYWETIGVIRTILDTPELHSSEAADGYFKEMLDVNLEMINGNRVQAMFGSNPVLTLSEEKTIRTLVTKRVAEALVDAREGGFFTKAITRGSDVKALTETLTPLITEALTVQSHDGRLHNYLNILSPGRIEQLKTNLVEVLKEHQGTESSITKITITPGRNLAVSVESRSLGALMNAGEAQTGQTTHRHFPTAQEPLSQAEALRRKRMVEQILSDNPNL